MQKTANIHARVNHDVKEKSAQVLDQLGISLTQFIELNLIQLIKEKAVRFELELLRDDRKENYIKIESVKDFKNLIK